MVRDSGIPYIIVRPSYFWQNMEAQGPYMKADVPFSSISTEDGKLTTSSDQK